jgi:hypothetical protein
LVLWSQLSKFETDKEKIMPDQFRLDNKTSTVTGHILYLDGGLLSTFGPGSW